ncbi:hypothetical protein niasHT_002401 [Heterodera trifolii]|uniref:B30.2/SPRY domain-containing protein n=1 Tax=Heterodera trifolii TaxID=157864 RepID=A0ABD2LM59_9BILA
MPKRRKDSFVQSSFGGNDNGQTAEGSSGPSVGADHLQQQQQTKLNEKCAKMEMDLTISKLEFENRVLKAESKQREIMDEFNALKKKVAKMEGQKEAAEERFSQLQNDQKKILAKIREMEKQQKEQSKATAEQLPKIMEKVTELEKQYENTTKDTLAQFSQLQNDQKKILEKTNEMDKEKKQKRTVLLNFEENCWDADACSDNLEIIGNKNLTVHYKGIFSGCWHSVFAKHPILQNNSSSDIFYYEISIKHMENFRIFSSVIFGFAIKEKKLDDTIRFKMGTYSCESNGCVWINGEKMGRTDDYSYGVGDTVGIGVHFITRQLFFTWNGQCLDSSGLFVAPSFADYSLYPFVTLRSAGGEIEANFGPNFKFDLATL